MPAGWCKSAAISKTLVDRHQKAVAAVKLPENSCTLFRGTTNATESENEEEPPECEWRDEHSTTNTEISYTFRKNQRGRVASLVKLR